jgi:hypothetical protein
VTAPLGPGMYDAATNPPLNRARLEELWRHASDFCPDGTTDKMLVLACALHGNPGVFHVSYREGLIRLRCVGCARDEAPIQVQVAP